MTERDKPDYGKHDGYTASDLLERTEDLLVSCFPDRAVMGKYLADLAWETGAWCADTPDHMIHLDGAKHLAPYEG